MPIRVQPSSLKLLNPKINFELKVSPGFLWVADCPWDSGYSQVISYKRCGYFLRIFLDWTEKHNWVIYENRVVHFGKTGSHKLVISFPMCDFLLHSHMPSCYCNNLYSNAIRGSQKCVIFIPESLSCEEVTTQWLGETPKKRKAGGLKVTPQVFRYSSKMGYVQKLNSWPAIIYSLYWMCPLQNSGNW